MHELTATMGSSAHDTLAMEPADRSEHDKTYTPRAPAPGNPSCLHEIFESQADATPDLPALACGGRTLTYGRVDAEANRVAQRLRRRGAGPGTFVGVYGHRSELTIIAVLGCLKAGAAYIPIDPTYPAERVRYIDREAGLLLSLTDRALSLRGAELLGPERMIEIEDCLARDDLPRSRLTRDETGVSPCDLAYVIFTSGSTGRPKGVMTEHQHATRFVSAFNKACGTTTGDRVYQGFSLSFDGSVEEMWMAFSNGSTLVVPTADAPRFGDELGEYLRELGVTYFSTVPTLLSTISVPVSSLRTVVLSGEVCPPRLVDAWAGSGVRILNVYGPTEATVNTTVFECLRGRPVTIGRPLEGYGVRIVDQNLDPVPPGVAGELLISSTTLARGYLNEPVLTEEKFPTVLDENARANPVHRCYRTGDLARWTEEGDLEFLGRLDGQVKIRGYRVELSEIENVLTEHDNVRSAGVRLVSRAGLHELAAYVVLRPPATTLEPGAVLSLLESKLPAYMIPNYLDVLAELPRTTSGKVDRRSLPDPVSPLVRVSGTVVAPQNEREHLVAEVWSGVLGIDVTSAADDFFLDFGGHSLVAAQMVTALRERTGLPVAVRDAYGHPTVQLLAARLDELAGRVGGAASPAGATRTPSSSREVFQSTPRRHRWITVGAQALSLYVLSAPVMIPTTIVFLLALGWVQGTVSTARLLLMALVVVPVVVWPVMLVFSIAAKWVLIGRYRPGEHRLWSFYYLRWWLVNRMTALSGAGALVGTPLLPVYFRLMGARIGPRCTLDTAQCSAWDLVSIGADTSIGADSQILCYRVEGGTLRLGEVRIGSRCFVGIHSALGLGVRMCDGSRLDDQSLLGDGEEFPPDEGRQGSPARKTAVSLPAERPDPCQSSGRRALFALAHAATTQVLAIVMLLPSVAFLLAYWFAFTRGGLIVGALTMVGSVPAGVVIYCLYTAAVKRALSHGIRPGTYSVLSWAYLRKWASDRLMGMTRVLMLPVYTTLYLPPFLRLLGARIGPRAEISTVWSFAPELIDVGPESFFADGSIIGGRRAYLGVFQIDVNRIGRRSFIGNGAVVPVGTSVGNGCLLGVQSIPPTGPRAPDSSEWLGSPSFPLTHRIKIDRFDETSTFRPTTRLYAERAVIDGIRVLFPAYLGLLTVTASALTLFVMYRNLGVVVTVALAPVLGLATGIAAAAVVALLKKCVMGTYRPEIKPLWCRYVWLNEMVNGAYESVFAPVVSTMLGTPFIAAFLRMMGCRIGRHTFIATTLFSEFDLVDVGDHVALNHGVVVQNHLFEDRVFKSSALTIADEASIGNMSVVLYDSKVRRGAVVGPLSLVMKGEAIEERSWWQGIPTSRVDGPRTPTSPAPSQVG